MKIRFKLIGLMLIIVIAPVLIISAVYSDRCTDAVRDARAAVLGSINSDKAGYLNEFLGNITFQEKSLVSDRTVRSFTEEAGVSGKPSETEGYEHTTEMIDEIVKRSEDISDLFIMSCDGMIIAAYDKQMEGTVAEDREKYIDWASANGGISPIFPAKMSTKCSFYSCRSIYSGGNQKIGIAVEKVTLEKIDRMLKIEGFSNYATMLLVDSDGKYITTSISTPKSLEDVVEYREIPKNIPDAIPYYARTVAKDTVKAEYENYTFYGTAVTNGNWSVVSVYNRSASKSDSKSMVKGIRFITVLVLAAAITGLVFVCLRFTKPVNQIIEIISKKNKGDTNLRLDIKSKDEFGQIAKEFNTMFDNIFDSEQRYRTVVSMLDNVVFEINLKAGTVYTSNNFNQKFSFRAKDDTVEESFLYKMKVHKDDQKRFKEDVENIVAVSAEKWEGEYRLKNFYGDFSWIKIKGKKFYDRNNAPYKIIGMLVDIDREKKSAINLIQKASFDALTQLYNRPTFLRMLEEEMHQSYSRRSLDALMFIDLDDFKHFNDEYGHKCGDEVLQFVADTIKEVTYEKGFGGRLGGDEFVMCLTNLKFIDDAGRIASETISILNDGFISESTELHLNIHCSIGIAFFRENGSNSAELLESADSAMYRIKKSGKSNYAYAGDGKTEKNGGENAAGADPKTDE